MDMSDTAQHVYPVGISLLRDKRDPLARGRSGSALCGAPSFDYPDSALWRQCLSHTSSPGCTGC